MSTLYTIKSIFDVSQKHDNKQLLTSFLKHVKPTGHVNKLDPQFFLNYSANIDHRPVKPFAMSFYPGVSTK